MSKKTAAQFQCVCGCGKPTRNMWYPGHDHRALVTYVKEKYGSIYEFLADTGAVLNVEQLVEIDGTV